MIHWFSRDIKGEELPRQFTYPFHYTPHELCVEASREVQCYLASREDWRDELHAGKMMGVLVVQCRDGSYSADSASECNSSGKVGFLVAFSGILAGSNCHDYFVPPVYDLLNPEGYFRAEEARISDINHRIDSIRAADEYKFAKGRLAELIAQRDAAIEQHKALMAESKARRDAARQNPDADHAAMTRESQWQKAELRRIKAHWEALIASAEAEIGEIENSVKEMKEERRRRSADLQRWLFSRFVMLNARGEKRDLVDIFAEATSQLPPAGAGECAAPKLLQYAYANGLKPVAMAEFWCGESPVGEVRHAGHFYPACRAKCLPILTFMLQGLDVEPNPLDAKLTDEQPAILYDDEWLVAMSKPAGMLTVPGKSAAPSLLDYVKSHVPGAANAMVVHRLDMDTSGIVIFAKDKDTHEALQRQFAERTVHKRYEALLNGTVVQCEGIISLPLGPNYEHRPQQMVDYEHGKPAVTRYEVLGVDDGVTRVAFYPLTGRTHQLRVHAAHRLGLNAPILGDRIYGRRNAAHRAATRMHLHARSISFTHPHTGRKLKIEN